MPAKVEESAPLPFSAMSPPATSVNEASGAAVRAFGAGCFGAVVARVVAVVALECSAGGHEPRGEEAEHRESSPPPRHHPDENVTVGLRRTAVEPECVFCRENVRLRFVRDRRDC